MKQSELIENFPSSTAEKSMVYLSVKYIFILMSYALWVDSVTGMIQFYSGTSVKLSLFYKLPIIGVMLFVIGAKSRVVFISILSAIVLLLLGSIKQFMLNPKVGFLINDLSLVIKTLTPFIAFYFCKTCSLVFPNLVGYYGPRILWFNFFAVLFNLLIGALGFGFPSYAGTDGEGGIGVNGFYVAGNELSGCYVLLFGYVLHHLWNVKRLLFYPMVLLTVICGMLIATKTAMLASVLLTFGIPIFNERRNIFRFTYLKLKIFIPIVIVSASLIYFILDLLKAIGLYEKIIWIMEEKGILGLILSGRLDYSTMLIDTFMSISGWFEYLFGIGTLGMSNFFLTKYSAEVDPVDLFVYFGVVGSAIIYFSLASMILPAFSVLKQKKFIPPIVVLVNLILLLLSVFSGHILNSGMLGLLWGLFNSMVYLEIKNKPNKYKRHEL